MSRFHRRSNHFVSLNFAAFLALSAAGAFALPAQAAGVPGGIPKSVPKDDAAKDSTLKDGPSQPAVNSNACFFTTDKGQSLVQGSCDVRALQVSAKDGQLYAQNQLGLVSALVVGQGSDIRQARSWFEKAARHGYAPAQVNLAVTYINGWGTSQNYGAALNWLNAAAKQDHPGAYANLGILYMNGWGVRRDYAEAFKDLEIAARAGDAGAQSNLGYLYDGGLGVGQDYSAAARWYHLAAENGNALGQNNLADLYLRGQGVRQSYPQAFYWFQKSAQQGHTGARIKLGFLLMNGLGTAKDSSAAYAWILSASQAGDHRGDEYLTQLQRDLDKQHLAQATQQARSLGRNAAQLNVECEQHRERVPRVNARDAHSTVVCVAGQSMRERYGAPHQRVRATEDTQRPTSTVQKLGVIAGEAKRAGLLLKAGQSIKTDAPIRRKPQCRLRVDAMCSLLFDCCCDEIRQIDNTR